MKKFSGSPTNKKRGLVLALAAGLFFSCHPSFAGETPDTGGKSGTPLTATRLYSRYISPVDGDRCTMWPTCSHYASDAVKKHGLLKGWIMACDRLLRCGGDELDSPKQKIINGRRYCADPVENNDFWWYNSTLPHKNK